VWVTSSLETVRTPTVIALGNFDGIHQGHCRVIQALRSARAGQAQVTVVAFNPHPQAFFSGQHQPLLTPLPEKTQLLEDLGVDQLVLIPFNRALANLSPQAFVEDILVAQLQAQLISVGFNFYFGYQRAGTAQDLVAIAGQYQIPVSITEPQTSGPEPISSSAIREALRQGNLAKAHQMLGRAYDLTGPVVTGQQLGRTLLGLSTHGGRSATELRSSLTRLVRGSVWAYFDCASATISAIGTKICLFRRSQSPNSGRL